MSQVLHSLYPLMLSPIKVGAHTLPNRVIMGSLHTRLENEPDGVQRLAEFYAARARGGIGLVVTGGVSPNFEGRVEQGAWVLDSPEQLEQHIPIVQAVHEAGAKIALQILHTGIYAKHDEIIGPSAVRSVINPRQPRAESRAIRPAWHPAGAAATQYPFRSNGLTSQPAHRPPPLAPVA